MYLSSCSRLGTQNLHLNRDSVTPPFEIPIVEWSNLVPQQHFPIIGVTTTTIPRDNDYDYIINPGSGEREMLSKRALLLTGCGASGTVLPCPALDPKKKCSGTQRN